MRQMILVLIALLMMALLTGCRSDEPPKSNPTPSVSVDATTVTTPAPTETSPSTSAPETPETTMPVTTAPITTAPITTAPITTAPATTEPPPPKVCEANLTSLTLSAKDNRSLAADLSFTIDETALTATLDLDYQHYADLATLSAAKLTAELTDGSVLFTAANDDGTVDLLSGATCVVADQDGLTKTYTLTVNRTVYQLPIVNITLTEGITVDEIDRNETTEMTFSLDASGAEGFDSLSPVTGKIRGRGNSTWKWEKKPYKIKLDEKASLLGLAENKDWILLANYADKSLIRNTVAYEMGRLLDGFSWSPTQYPVDLFVNGEYRGVYSLGEHMEVAKGRVEIDESNDVDTGYLIEIGGVTQEEVDAGVDYFHTQNKLVKFAAFKAPNDGELTEAQRAFIVDYFQKAEDAIIAGEGYEEYIDVDSFVDWILLHELTYNLDSCFRRSCFITKDKGGKLTMGPIWDFDLAFGNFSRDAKNHDNLITVGSPDEDAYVLENWCTYLMKDPEFTAKLWARWQAVKEPLLDKAYETIDTYSALLDGSQQANFEVWQIWDIKAGYQSNASNKANTYPKQIQYIKDFLEERAEWMDENLPRG